MALKIPVLPNADDNVLRLFPEDPEKDRRVFETWWYQYWDDLARYIKANAGISITVPFVTPEQFGAIGDGIINDTVAVQAAINDGRAVMMHSEAVYAIRSLTLRSNLTIFGLPGATVRQLAAVAINNTPFISGSSINNLSITGLRIDGNKGAQPGVTNVCGLFLEDVDGVQLIDCETIATSGQGVGGAIWKNFTIQGQRASTWGIGNEYAAIYKQDATISPAPAAGTSYNILISGCNLDGTGSGSCIKLTAQQDNDMSQVDITGNTVKIGYHGAIGQPAQLAIELFAGGSGEHIHHFVIANNIVDSDNAAGDIDAFGISVSQGFDGSITGNTVRNTGAYCIEVIGSRIAVIGNTCINVGRIGLTLPSTTAFDYADVVITGNIVKTIPDTGTFPQSGIHVYSAGTNAWKRVSVNNNTIELTGNDQYGIWFQNAASADVIGVQCNANIIDGGGHSGGVGIATPGASGSGCIFATNYIENIDLALAITGLKQSRVLWNIFGAGVVATYLGSPAVTTMIVDVSNTEGVSFAPPSVQIRGRQAPVIDALGNLLLDQGSDTGYLGTVAPGVDANPNPVYLNRVNFGTELQGGILSVNSYFTGNPNWAKGSTGSYNGAMFLVLGAGAFVVQFGPAANAGSTAPGTNAFAVISKDNVHGEAPRVYTGTDYPIQVQLGASLRSGSVSPNSNVTGSPGDFYQSTGGSVWYKATGTGNTGWVQLTAGSGGTVTSVALSLPGFLTVSGSPVTTSGTLAAVLATQSANLVFAGPATGAAAAPTFRALVAADLPGAAGAWTTFTPSMLTNVGGPVTIVASECAWQAQVLNPKQVAIRYTVEFTVGTTAAAVVMSMPVTPKASTAQYSQCFAMNYQDNGLTPRTCWNAIEPGFSRVVMFLFSGSFVSGANHYIELNGVIEIA